MNPQNLGWSLEGTEHKDDSAIVPQMCDGLDSATGEIQIDDGEGGEDAQSVASLGRTIHMLAITGRRRSEEEMLALDPGDKVRREGVVYAAHAGSIL